EASTVILLEEVSGVVVGHGGMEPLVVLRDLVAPVGALLELDDRAPSDPPIEEELGVVVGVGVRALAGLRVLRQPVELVVLVGVVLVRRALEVPGLRAACPIGVAPGVVERLVGHSVALVRDRGQAKKGVVGILRDEVGLVWDIDRASSLDDAKAGTLIRVRGHGLAVDRDRA